MDKAPLETGLIGGVEQRRIEIVAYDPRWPETFRTHAQLIATVLGEAALQIEHIGSTAVPGLGAKAIIDILLVVANSAEEPSYLPAMLAAGYELRVREPDFHEHRMLRTPARDVHIHVFSSGAPEIERYLVFRDRLRNNAEDRRNYESTKRRLAAQPWPDMNAYAEAKTEVIESILAATRVELNLTRLRAARLVDRLEYHESLPSTNDYLREVAARVPRSENMLVLAERQTAGRGRGANRWWTGPESLAFSLLFDPATRDVPQRSFPLLSLAAAVALIETVAPLVGTQEIGLHWPNDVFAAGRKLAGILVEALPDGRLVLGIGCNVNHRANDAPAELADTLVTLADLSGKKHDRTGLLLVLLERLDETFDFLARSPEALARRANALCLQHGRKLTLAAGSRQAVGLCAGIAEDGALLLDTARGRERFYSGVILRAGEEGKKM